MPTGPYERSKSLNGYSPLPFRRSAGGAIRWRLLMLMGGVAATGLIGSLLSNGLP